ncbi:MAG: hypothetical protein ACO1OB_15405 [Archangium sp.]
MNTPQKRHATATRVVSALVFLGLIAGCRPVDELPADAGPIQEMDSAWAGTCTRSETLVTSRARCTRDENCPCGTGCELGVCVARCAWSDECLTGTVCDSFGRCVAPELANLPDLISGQPRGTMSVDRVDMALATQASVEAARLKITGLDAPRVRVTGDDGLEVACGAEAPFALECEFQNLPAGEQTSVVKVRAASGAFPTSDVRKSLHFFSQGQHLVVGVALRGAGSAEPAPRFGVYAGRARMIGAGLRARTVEDTLPEELTRLELPVRAEIYPPVQGVYTLRLFDVRKTVFPTDSVATMSLKPGTQELELVMPSRQYLGPDSDVVDATQLDVHASGRMDAPTFRDGLLDGELVVTFEGISPSASAPFVRWSLTLVRAGDLPPGATPPQVSARPVSDPVVRAAPLFSEETVGRQALGTFGNSPTRLEQIVGSLCSASSSAQVTGYASSVYGPNELNCGNGTRQKAFGLDRGRLENRGEYLTNCVSGLAVGAGATFGDASIDGACLNRSRVLTALGYATALDRDRAFGASLAIDPDVSRQALRLMQQWMNVQSVVGMEPRRLNALAPLLPSGSNIDKLRQYSDWQLVFTSLQRSVSAWDLLLHPRFGAALMAAPPEAIGVPDYRRAFLPQHTFPPGEQSVGIPVTMLFTLSQQLNGMQGLVDDLLFSRAPQGQVQPVSSALADFLPRSVVVFAAAQGLRDAARSVGTPVWEDQWRAARSSWGTSTSRLLRQLEFFEQGRNALGIEDGDLPLYRIGDQAGVSRRFSAVSDSLLGREDLLDPAIAPTLIAQAREVELLARDSVSALLQRDLTQQQEDVASARRVEDLKRYYGEQITSFCNEYGSLTVLDLDPPPDPETCYVSAACRFSIDDYKDRLNIADLGYQICMAHLLRQRFGAAITTGQKTLDAQLDGLPPATYDIDTPFFSSEFSVSIRNGFAAGYEGVRVPQISIPSGIDTRAVKEIQETCEGARQSTLALRPTTAPERCTSTDECPVDFVCRSQTGVCQPDTDLARPECFNGSLGEAALAVRGAATEVDVARSELEEYSERYDNAMRGCFILQQGNEAVEAVMSQHNATMSELANAKFVADQTAAAAEKARDLFSLDKPWQWIGSLIFGGVQQAAESTADTIELRMDAAERQHELTVTKLENATEVRQCINEAEAEFVGARSASLRVKAQAQALTLTLLQFNNLKISMQAAIDDGHTSIAAETYRKVSVAQVDFWLDQNLDLYQQRMRRARRALFLAVLATEYEFQFTSLERARTLAAKTPTELEDTLRRVRDLVRRGAPSGGGSPTQLVTVMSLKKNLLQLADRSRSGEGTQPLSDTQRLQRILTSPQYAAFDDRGRYLGQELPFSIQPLGTLGLADTGALPLLSGLNCAERLWAVNATVVGDSLMTGTDSSIATLQVRKRNTFASQRCTDLGLLPATTRPSQNLFVDPYSANSWGQDSVLVSLTDTRETSTYSFSTVQARTNVSQRELERVGYTDGQSTALAGRGVFGDYALFIPASTLSVGGRPGLQLANVSDVLIRLDYVAAELR